MGDAYAKLLEQARQNLRRLDPAKADEIHLDTKAAPKRLDRDKSGRRNRPRKTPTSEVRRLRLEPTPEQQQHFALILRNNAELWTLCADVFDEYRTSPGSGLMHGNELVALLEHHWKATHPDWQQSPAETLRAVCQAVPEAFKSAGKKPLRGKATTYVARGRTYTTAARSDPLATHEAIKFHLDYVGFHRDSVFLTKKIGAVRTPDLATLGFLHDGVADKSLRIKGAQVWHNPDGVWYVTVRFDRAPPKDPSRIIPLPTPWNIMDTIWAGCEARIHARPKHGDRSSVAPHDTNDILRDLRRGGIKWNEKQLAAFLRDVGVAAARRLRIGGGKRLRGQYDDRELLAAYNRMKEACEEAEEMLDC